MGVSVGEIVGGGKSIWNWFTRRSKEARIRAWHESDFKDIVKVLNAYYEARNVPLFSYPHASGKPLIMPLYVRPEWGDLTNEQLKMNYSPEEHKYVPDKLRKDFFEFYVEMRQHLGMKPIWNGRLFRLTNLQTSNDEIELSFEHGQFFDSTMCHYILEDELVRWIAKHPVSAQARFKLRDKIAGDDQAIEQFCKQYVSRIGVSNLMLLKKDEDTYVAMIQSRGSQSMATGFEPVSSGVFGISTVPIRDFDLMHRVLTEIYEELYRGEEVEREAGRIDPEFFYKQAGIADIRELLEKGDAFFEVTGFCIDLIRLIPEVTTILVINDASYYQRYRGSLTLSGEHLQMGEFVVAPNIQDLDKYLANDILTRPNGNQRGFDPLLWTLPGGFCFNQGLKRATSKNLL